MRCRALDSTGDYTFGHGRDDFLADQPELVRQLIRTRLLLMSGEWFLDVTEGTPYQTEIVGEHTQLTYDVAIQSRITGTPGVLQITSYSSTVIDRNLQVDVTLDTIYGPTRLTGIIAPDGSVSILG
jgi:hypothetical protein